MSIFVNNSSSLGSTTGSAVLTGSGCADAVVLDINGSEEVRKKKCCDFHIKRLLNLARRPIDDGSMADPRLKGNEVEEF